MELVERKETSYAQTFTVGHIGGNPDVEKTEMKLSNSNSKFVHVYCDRTTFPIEYSESLSENSSENLFRNLIEIEHINLSETSSENSSENSFGNFSENSYETSSENAS